MVDAEELGKRAERRIEELALVSAERERLVRLFLSPEHRMAADLVARWMTEAGLQVTEDALGTVRGRWGAPPRLLLGSHLDSVIDAGKYDGPLGVISGILTAEHFVRAGRKLPFGIDVLAFGDEEGSRFPSVLSTSAAAAGHFDPSTLELADSKGITYRQALEAYGKNPKDISQAAYARGEAIAYVEVHIEQGPVLEEEGEPLGVVTGIVGQNRLRVIVQGVAGHAGTVPMDLRRDAMAGAAETVLAVERIARAHGDDRMVGTVGRIEALPGAVNIIPARVTFTIDLRSMSDNVRRKAIAEIKAEAWRIVETRGLQVTLEPFLDTPTTPMDSNLQAALAEAIRSLGNHPIFIPSGAGHDAQMMAKLCPSAMLFVRCRGGVSHNPAEYTSSQDMGAGIAALIGFVDRLAMAG